MGIEQLMILLSRQYNKNLPEEQRIYLEIAPLDIEPDLIDSDSLDVEELL